MNWCIVFKSLKMIPSIYQEVPIESTFAKRFVQAVSDLIGLAVCFGAFIIIYLVLVIKILNSFLTYKIEISSNIFYLFIRVLGYFIIHAI